MAKKNKRTEFLVVRVSPAEKAFLIKTAKTDMIHPFSRWLRVALGLQIDKFASMKY